MYYVYFNSNYLFPLKDINETYEWIGFPAHLVSFQLDKESLKDYEEEYQTFLEDITNINNIEIYEKEEDEDFTLGLGTLFSSYSNFKIYEIKSDFNTITFIFYEKSE